MRDALASMDDATAVRACDRGKPRRHSTSSSAGISARCTSFATGSSGITKTPATSRRTSSSVHIAACGDSRETRRSRTWLYRIGVNVCLNRVGTRSRPIQTQLGTDRCRRLPRGARRLGAASQRACGAGPVGDRAAALVNSARHSSCACITRCRTKQIAGVLGSSVGAVKANFFHALANLRKLLRA